MAEISWLLAHPNRWQTKKILSPDDSSKRSFLKNNPIFWADNCKFSLFEAFLSPLKPLSWHVRRHFCGHSAAICPAFWFFCILYPIQWISIIIHRKFIEYQWISPVMQGAANRLRVAQNLILWTTFRFDEKFFEEIELSETIAQNGKITRQNLKFQILNLCDKFVNAHSILRN